MNEANKLWPGWMVETAWKYAKVAQIAWDHGNLGLQSEINAALAVEILLKSLLADPVKNENHGTIMTNFSSKHGHDLWDLYKSIDEDIKINIDLKQHEYIFLRKRAVFKNKRYQYEPHSEGLRFDNGLLHAAGEMIPKIVDFFVENGSRDLWLLDYQEDRNYFRLPTGISLGGWAV